MYFLYYYYLLLKRFLQKKIFVKRKECLKIKKIIKTTVVRLFVIVLIKKTIIWGNSVKNTYIITFTCGY